MLRGHVTGPNQGLAEQISHTLQSMAPALRDANALDAILKSLVSSQLTPLPLPGSGATLERWRVLGEVAANDLSLVKLFEGHTDALAILAELHALDIVPAHSTWGTWASEVPGNRVILEDDPSGAPGAVRLNGRKAWCSGASVVSHGLLTAWHADGTGPYLVAVCMQQRAVQVSGEDWHALGMAASASFEVTFTNASATKVGGAGDYLSRPGFWQGGCGIAACWLGGAQAIAQQLHRAMRENGKSGQSPLRCLALGKVDLALQQTAAVLREAATWIDAHPLEDAQVWALRTRLSAEACAEAVLATVGHALGAAPFCRDPQFARMAADLPVFIRQSHAERDFVALGELTTISKEPAWKL